MIKCDGKEIWGMNMYICTLVVDSEAQGLGIGRMLFEEMKKDMFCNRIFSVKLMTKRDIPAYKIYKYMGFEETEKYVHMQRY